jgi:serine O-acetyltransferase
VKAKKATPFARAHVSSNEGAERKPAAPSSRGGRNANPEDISFWGLIREDYQTNERDLFSQGFWALAIHRFGNWRMSVRWKILRAPLTILYRFLTKACQIFCGIYLPYTVQVGRRVKLEHFGGMVLVARKIGNDVIIRHNTTFGIRTLSDLKARPTIQDGVRIGAGAVIAGDIVVGRGSFIGANAVVERDVPPYCKAIGNPCKIYPGSDSEHWSTIRSIGPL